MPDVPAHGAPANWGDAFARMPAESPAPDGWQRVAATLDAAARAGSPAPRTSRSQRPRVAGWLALAATLVVAGALPWQDLRESTTGPGAGPAVDPEATLAQARPAEPLPTLAELHAESALLETLLAHARDGSVATGSAAAMAAELEARVAAIDGALATPGLDAARERALWNERVEALQALVGFEGTRRWLAANGEQYDGVLVQVN